MVNCWCEIECQLANWLRSVCTHTTNTPLDTQLDASDTTALYRLAKLVNRARGHAMAGHWERAHAILESSDIATFFPSSHSGCVSK
jgi:hypothetical protein